VESRYIDGKPLHHQPSARAIDYSPQASEFFVTTAEDFARLKGHQVQDIFRHRHIVIPGTGPEDLQFNHQGLASLGLLMATRQIQGVCHYSHN
jgi:hypothetical protein